MQSGIRQLGGYSSMFVFFIFIEDNISGFGIFTISSLFNLHLYPHRHHHSLFNKQNHCYCWRCCSADWRFTGFFKSVHIVTKFLRWSMAAQNAWHQKNPVVPPVPTGPQGCSFWPETLGPGWHRVSLATQTTSLHPAGTALNKQSKLANCNPAMQMSDLAEENSLITVTGFVVWGSVPSYSPQCCPGVFLVLDTSWGRLATRPAQCLCVPDENKELSSAKFSF